MKLFLTMGAVGGGLDTAETSQIARIEHFTEALSLCIQISRVKRTDANLAVSAGIHPAQFSRIRQGKAHLPTEKIPVIERLCGNTAITQWLASQHGASLKFETPEEKIARLEKQIQEMVA